MTTRRKATNESRVITPPVRDGIGGVGPAKGEKQ
jgi:hypothetical protein